MSAEDQQLMGEVSHVLPHAEVAFEGSNLLLDPTGKRMRAGSSDLETMLGSELHHASTQPDDLILGFQRRAANLGADFDHTLMQLSLHRFAHHQLTLIEELSDVRLEFAGLRIDDLIFFFDADGQRRGLHGGFLRAKVLSEIVRKIGENSNAEASILRESMRGLTLHVVIAEFAPPLTKERVGGFGAV
ncbi:MAG: hypothetical protein QM703_24005 [Gemmatales bacterium]